MKYRWLAFAAVLIVTAVLYWPSLHGPFLFDDIPNLAALTSIDHVSSWRDLGIYLSQPRSFPGRPLAMLSFLLQKSSWPEHPFPFHLVNLLLHLICGALVYLITQRVARDWLRQRKIDETRAWIPSTLAAAIWLLDPIQLSGVMLVVQRMTLLMAMFVLLGLLAYLRGLLSEHQTSAKRGAWMFIGLGVCMMLAFLSKENGILLPLYALVLDATILRGTVQRLPARLRWWRRLLIWPTVLFVAGYLLWMAFLQWGQPSIRHFTIGERLLTEPRILLDYLSKIFLPRFGIYGLYHDGYAISRNLLSPWTTLPALIIILALVTTAFLQRRRWPLFALAVLWYFGGQLLESSSVMLELYFEHRNYTPLIGIVMAIALAVASMHENGRKKAIFTVLGLWLVACCITTSLSARVYTSEDRLAITWANDQPNSIRAKTFLADRLFKHGQIDSALQVIRTISRRYPNNSVLAENRVYLRCIQGTLKTSDINQLNAILRKSSFDRGGFENMEPLRKLAFTNHCPSLNPSSWMRLADTLLANPAYREDSVAAGFLHYQKHFWAVSKGNLDLAIHELDLTYSQDPDAEIPRLKAKYLVSAGLYDQAIAALQDTDYARLPRLRRWLVNDRAINAEDIKQIEAMKRKVQSPEPTLVAPATATSSPASR
ncbi:ArnT family glycosyltransferase [Oleiagrimonas soli]|uniref:Tetratricopeptide repeat protein n=1 Tax=Oleiagrimonas soli TaxID=1543381 RepID=A0A099CUD3_9GAMM|nr:hypothetical protein [Oleiagrimonas soli]KGI77242.1 hypothetical protein LF63_0111660 [Oleiagrimonas soli]MBB6185569.1 hypothetical protein [Oleiagrimonas soli]